VKRRTTLPTKKGKEKEETAGIDGLAEAASVSELHASVGTILYNKDEADLISSLYYPDLLIQWVSDHSSSPVFDLGNALRRPEIPIGHSNDLILTNSMIRNHSMIRLPYLPTMRMRAIIRNNKQRLEIRIQM
jgi:hypothetical protein